MRTIRFLLCSLAIGSISAATLPAGFVESEYGNYGPNIISNPTAMDFSPDGRLFLCQQGGSLRVIKAGTLLATPFLTVPVDSSGERGLLGVAFDPNFASNGFVYVYYTATSPTTHNRVSRFTADPANPDVALAGSEVQIVNLEDLSSATNHNGGAIHFGLDGKLYIAVGENANSDNSQTLGNRLGKILRYNSDGTIPTNNPFFSTATGESRSIWVLGLRNPFTFAVQPGTGRIFINDVGEVTWEEINDSIAGSNYGWRLCEGFCSPPNSLFRDPLFTYPHSGGAITGCAITGGAFYNPPVQQFPVSFNGNYFFADLCGGWIRLLNTTSFTASDFAAGISNPVDLKTGADGALYYLARGAGKVFRVAYGIPQITSQPQNQTVTAGQTAMFSVTATGAAPLAYQWFKNNVAISGANNPSYTTPTTIVGDSGSVFRCDVSNTFGTAPSNNATLTVNPVGAAQLDSAIASKSGPGGRRVWTIRLSNTGTAVANAARLDNITLTQTAGPSCSVARTTAMPVNFGNIAAGASATGNVQWDFGGCASKARFTATLNYSANSGATTGSKSFPNQSK